METKNGTLVRTNLTADEYAEIRKLAIDAKQGVGEFCGDVLRLAIPKRRKGARG